MNHSDDIAQIFKAEYSNLVAVLCHFYNVANIQIAEDIVSETFLKAMKTWSHKGIPDSPKSWLRKTAKNLLIDQIRRYKNLEENVIPNLELYNNESIETAFSEDVIEDSQLKMIFVVCDPKLNKEAQICLALRVLSGFNIDEIAKALFLTKETVNKKLYRAKKTIKLQDSLSFNLSNEAYIERLDNVLRVIYLIFNEGYYSSINEKNIRKEICWEAMHLCVILERNTKFSKSKVQALLALMCFHASRFAARSSDDNFIYLYNQQDKSKWDIRLIKKGEELLNKSATGNIVSKYHLEAAIAYWHTTEKETKWNNILQLYNKLLTIEYSPIIAMNRTFALAKANSLEEAIKEALKLNIEDNHYYYCLIAELYGMDSNKNKEIKYLKKAIKVATKSTEKLLIEEKIKKASR